MSPGEVFAAEVSRYFRLTSRSRRYRKGEDLHARIVEAVELAAQYPGYYGERTEAALRPASMPVYGYRKHIQGYRAAPAVCAAVAAMSPQQFARHLGAMIDAGVEHAGAAERFYQQLLPA